MIIDHRNNDEYLELARLDKVPQGLGLFIPLDKHLRFKDTRYDLGTPTWTIENYLKFKYCVAGIQLIVNSDWTDKPLPEEDRQDVPQWEDIVIHVPTTNYLVYFMSSWRKFGLKIKIPHPVFSWYRRPRAVGFNPKIWKKLKSKCNMPNS